MINVIKESGPLVTEILPLSTLSVDFSGHNVYLEKLELLKELYVGIRRVRRDGNCCYRAFGFALIEYFLKGNRVEEAKRFIRCCDMCRATLIENGYTQFTVEDFHEQFTEMVEQFMSGKSNLVDLEELFNNQSYSDYYVVFLRLLVSAYIQRNADFYANFIAEGKTVRQFCETEVEPMGLQSDNVHVAALALATGVPICVENCQVSGELKKLVFPATLSSSDASVATTEGHALNGTSATSNTTTTTSEGVTCDTPITLLYRPGHYDILYSS
ncbi:unnamed protein product [Schistocephalus solidus]|uniref:Ubiquitin thioesterase n=1 Tax=Schistocephalus solidus TaxID=70667 RepID=A0A183SNC0_SCHSO|nr:unnamed protein product [Schistocephalus solidus]